MLATMMPALKRNYGVNIHPRRFAATLPRCLVGSSASYGIWRALSKNLTYHWMCRPQLFSGVFGKLCSASLTARPSLIARSGENLEFRVGRGPSLGHVRQTRFPLSYPAIVSCVKVVSWLDTGGEFSASRNFSRKKNVIANEQSKADAQLKPSALWLYASSVRRPA